MSHWCPSTSCSTRGMPCIGKSTARPKLPSNRPRAVHTSSVLDAVPFLSREHRFARLLPRRFGPDAASAFCKICNSLWLSKQGQASSALRDTNTVSQSRANGLPNLAFRRRSRSPEVRNGVNPSFQGTYLNCQTFPASRCGKPPSQEMALFLGRLD
jgi:hypothetical protein